MPRPDHRTRRLALTRALRALLAIGALLAALAIPAQAEDQSQPPAGEQPPSPPAIVIAPADGRPQRTVLYSAVEGLATTGDWVLPDGTEARLTAVKLESVLGKAGLSVRSFTTLTVVGSDGVTMQISQLQMGKFYPPPIVYLDDAGALCVLRPKTKYEPSERACAADGRLTLDGGSGPTLTATPATVEVGQEVWFSASVPLGLEGRTVELVWDFNDDKPTVTTTERDQTRTFDKAGTYNVIVTYRVDGQRYGDVSDAPSTTVSVVDKSRPSKDRNGRTSRKHDRADDSGDEPGDEDGTTGTESGAGGAGPGGTGPGGGGWTPPSNAATPPPPAAPRPERRAPRSARRTPQQPVGETVDGYLLASADVPLPTGGAVRAADLRPTAVAEQGGFGVPTGAWVVIGLVALIVLGWTLESRTTLPYFKP